jgi:hypothetical protein
MMHRFGCFRLGCAGCASGSWSDLLRVIGRDHFLSVCPDSCRDHMLYSIVCCYHVYHRLCISVVEDHSDFAAFVLVIHLVSPFVHFSLSAIECVRHGVCHGGLTNYCILSTKKVGKNTCEEPIQMLSIGVGASIFTFVKTCV